MKIPPELIPIIEEMLYEFMDNRLDVCLVPSQDENCAKDGGMIRVATTQNPEWYQEMCFEFPRPGRGGRKKKPRTIVKRIETIKLINRLIKLRKSESKYAPYVIWEAERRLESYSPNIDLKVAPF